jgi:hypothetical protein
MAWKGKESQGKGRKGKTWKDNERQEKASLSKAWKSKARKGIEEQGKIR